MELKDYLRIARHRWLLITLVTLGAIAVAIAATDGRPQAPEAREASPRRGAPGSVPKRRRRGNERSE